MSIRIYIETLYNIAWNLRATLSRDSRALVRSSGTLSIASQRFGQTRWRSIRGHNGPTVWSVDVPSDDNDGRQSVVVVPSTRGKAAFFKMVETIVDEKEANEWALEAVVRGESDIVDGGSNDIPDRRRREE